HALPVDVTGPDVTDVVVERPAAVRGLDGALGPGGLGQQRLVGAGTGGRGLPAGQCRPGGDAVAGTAAGAVLVLDEGVEGTAVLVGQDGAEAGLRDLHPYHRLFLVRVVLVRVVLARGGAGRPGAPGHTGDQSGGREQHRHSTHEGLLQR